MAASDHRYVARPRNVAFKVANGRAVGCTCGAVTIVGTVLDGIRWHATHRTELPDPRTAELAEIRSRLAEIERALDALGAH